MENKKCPLCGNELEDYPAISRIDNETEICSNCGVSEALIPQTKDAYIGLWAHAHAIPDGFMDKIKKRLK